MLTPLSTERTADEWTIYSPRKDKKPKQPTNEVSKRANKFFIDQINTKTAPLPQFTSPDKSSAPIISRASVASRLHTLTSKKLADVARCAATETPEPASQAKAAAETEYTAPDSSNTKSAARNFGKARAANLLNALRGKKLASTETETAESITEAKTAAEAAETSPDTKPSERARGRASAAKLLKTLENKTLADVARSSATEIPRPTARQTPLVRFKTEEVTRDFFIEKVRFSQDSVRCCIENRQSEGVELPYTPLFILKKTFQDKGFDHSKDPILLVEIENDAYITLDNRRVTAIYLTDSMPGTIPVAIANHVIPLNSSEIWRFSTPLDTSRAPPRNTLEEAKRILLCFPCSNAKHGASSDPTYGHAVIGRINKLGLSIINGSREPRTTPYEYPSILPVNYKEGDNHENHCKRIEKGLKFVKEKQIARET